MTKKHFQALADAIHARLSVNPTPCEELDGLGGYQLALRLIASDISIVCEMNNPRFDRARFLAACGLEG